MATAWPWVANMGMGMGGFNMGMKAACGHGMGGMAMGV